VFYPIDNLDNLSPFLPPPSPEEEEEEEEEFSIMVPLSRSTGTCGPRRDDSRDKARELEHNATT